MAKIQCWTRSWLWLVVLTNPAVAITTTKSDAAGNSNEAEGRSYGNGVKPFRFDGESSKVKYETTYDKYRVQDRDKHRDRHKIQVDRDSEALSSGQFDNGFYGPPEETDMNYQGFSHGTTYVSTVPFAPTHGDKDTGIPNGFQRPAYGLEHQGHGVPQYQGHLVPQHYGPDPHALALKSLFLPLAGVALLGAAAALASNPVLLQLGVISGKRRRRSIREDPHIHNMTSPYKYHMKTMHIP